ncbi:sialate O-acetylesterase [Stratiformator vulcanicus]|uniref:Sialate O-acetylesterase domain-containing protein n=1 Tax=Stratiformator vulcanicus TaxID=2527980 RepID=A0A517R6T1_9PLAN|nr:sialate O-acetylesterase [Stratiformator vulcanicus]QDT39606.1 hypothetical protein Pan189_40150 [Stratiformator vulcanicus]
MLSRWLITAAICLSTALPASAELKLPSIFSDNMVVQGDAPIHVWGEAEAGANVSVDLTLNWKSSNTASSSTRSHSTVAGDDGHWKVELNPIEFAPEDATASGSLTVKSGNDSATFNNVLLGDVWICSGQSNMGWQVRNSNNAKEEIANAANPNIRLFTVKKVTSLEPVDDVEGTWVECSPQTVPTFSAVGYFFGREMQQHLDRPIGLINTSWGGTPSEAWTSKEMIEQVEEFDPLVARWNEIARRAEAGNPQLFRGKPLDGNNPHRPANIYNAMIHPLIPFTIKGAIWYQGESNATRAHQYRTIFPAMITDWRKNWGQGDFPFILVQLANWKQRSENPYESPWAELREAQSDTLEKLPNTGMAVTIDIGEADDIHPRNKQDVGKRLALAARKVAYGEDIVHSGPTFKSFKAEGSQAKVQFENTGSGLMTQGDELLQFEVAEGDGRFVFADAEIVDSETVVVTAPKDSNIESIDAIRYAWAENPQATLYNREGLPAVPFRTDDRKGATFGKE